MVTPFLWFQDTMPQPVSAVHAEQAWGQQVKLWDFNDDDNAADDRDNYNETVNMMESPSNLFKLAKQPLGLGKVVEEKAGSFGNGINVMWSQKTVRRISSIL